MVLLVTSLRDSVSFPFGAGLALLINLFSPLAWHSSTEASHFSSLSSARWRFIFSVWASRLRRSVGAFAITFLRRDPGAPRQFVDAFAFASLLRGLARHSVEHFVVFSFRRGFRGARRSIQPVGVAFLRRQRHFACGYVEPFIAAFRRGGPRTRHRSAEFFSVAVPARLPNDMFLPISRVALAPLSCAVFTDRSSRLTFYLWVAS